ncbi:MAG: hypothetical protein JO290_02465 [Sphingomonadaceae bacterium]|nr:hypothetical protein [Sphingomonadaceae bacterium]
MDDDANSAIQSILETIDNLKTRIAALEDEARTAADGAADKASAATEAAEAAIAAKIDPLGTRLDRIEQYLSGILPNQVLTQSVAFNP